ncbi:P-loop containing nucleoside triphosphate hydrolase protein [Podospora conica]|nr:P-loop containing nucleoside triphosphate hydrolase protein [Schizothecium conicum]
MGRLGAELDALERIQLEKFGITSGKHFRQEAVHFRKALKTSFDLAINGKGKTSRAENPLFWNLRSAYVKGAERGLGEELRYSFQSYLLRNKVPKAVTQLQLDLADLRNPYEWYPKARMMKRTVHLHVGPTNSGKTYHALKALENSKSGLYAGPLRLLAHEIYTRFQAMGKPCALITGEEQRLPENTDQFFQSCTVEMVPLHKKVDVAVIDEIQMIADDDRGWAWTQAFLGIQATELHVCGEARTVELIQYLCSRTGDDCVVHRYERLNALHTMNRSLNGSFKNLEKGDCVVGFSRLNLHKLKSGIESQTGRKCAIVYGSLPPETRVHQAALFNDPDNDYDFLVASDAIGMGLNLEIKRVIFETATKFDGTAQRGLTVPEIKQIGGRAGRFKSAAKANQQASSAPGFGTPATAASARPEGFSMPGYVTTMDDEDLPAIQEGFETEVGPIKTAGILPPGDIVERFASYFSPETPFAFVLARLRELCRVSSKFHLCDFSSNLKIAEITQDLNLAIRDRCVFNGCPVSERDEQNLAACREMAAAVANLETGDLLRFKALDLEALQYEDKPVHMTEQDFIARLESLHKSITMYLWLSYRYKGVFQNHSLAFHVKELVEKKIEERLNKLNFVPELMKTLRSRKRMAAQHHREVAGLLDVEEGEEGSGEHGEGYPPSEAYEEPLFEDADELSNVESERKAEAEAGQA